VAVVEISNHIMAEKKKMSVAEIMAAARKADSQGQSAAPPVAEATAAEAAAAEAAASEPAVAEAPVAEAAPPPAAAQPKPKPAAVGGARPSVSDILKAAREGKAAAAAAPAAAQPPVPKPTAPKPTAPKPTAPKPAPAAKPAAAKQPAAEKAAVGVKDTGSILAAARNQHKPGPMSKSEAAAKLLPEAPAKGKAPKAAVPPMPPKPEYARPKAKEAAAASGEDRRSFLSFAVGSFLGAGFTSLAATVGLWTLGTARFMFPNVLIEPPSQFKVGFPSDFAPGMVEEKFKAQFGVWVVKAEYQGQLQIYALRTVCTHLGCTPNWLEGEQKFKCPCHGSGFYKDGINFEGPAPRPLERYSIHLADDGQLEIDKSKLFQEEMGQWKDAASFVPV
jgi:cytochrome b6-f complex iron-sulfur subunit